MLDTDTKRRIDTARDILVGKVPDPKSQVEQITIALIYKFMDDMDAEAEELGGKRKFFTGDYARFGWAKLMRAGLGGHETLNLYAESIATMPKNPGIPPLFREIFKNAYLPYRDPETLKSFLKIIDEFSYDHSERLGDAFEYLLSVLGSQGDAGQFRTPRHIIDFIVSIVDPKKTDTILDPACGTAGFLISAYKHVLSSNTDAKGKVTLTPDERGRLAQHIKGYDISPDMVRLSLVNLYLHGFTDPHIYEYDTLTSEERWNETADVILANPPFMSPKGGIKPHKRFSVPSNRSEVLFVDYMIEHLSAQGRAGIIVPEGVIFQNGAAYKRLREVLVKEFLIGVISLPSGVFQPYSGVKTSILILDRQAAKSRPNILFSNVREIGVSLGVKRTITERNDLPLVIKDFITYQLGKSALSSHSFLADRNAILANDCNLSSERYRPIKVRAGTRLVKLKEVCSLVKGTHSSTKTEAGPHPLIVTAKEWLTSTDFQVEGQAVCVPLISSTGHGRASLSRIHYASGKFAVANLLAVLQSKDNRILDTRFLYLVLDGLKTEMANLMKGAANVSMKVEDLAEFPIPLPPLETQKEIVAEVEGYQKVIDGARVVLDHYRPFVPVKPDWPTLPLGEAAILKTGTTPDTSRREYYVGDINFVKTGEITNNQIGSTETHISEQAVKDYNLTIFPPGTILMAMYGQGKTRGQVGYLKIPACTTQNAAAITPGEELEPRFLFYYFLGQYDALRDHGINGHISHLNIAYLKKFKVPIPPRAIQENIVLEIESERTLIDANHMLIARFEKKIQATLTRVWGEDES